jgi:hypothetical protein
MSASEVMCSFVPINKFRIVVDIALSHAAPSLLLCFFLGMPYAVVSNALDFSNGNMLSCLWMVCASIVASSVLAMRKSRGPGEKPKSSLVCFC